jgi:hypothetical protein
MSTFNDFLNAAGNLTANDVRMLNSYWKHTPNDVRFPYMKGNAAIYMKGMCEPPKMVTDRTWAIMICADVPSKFSFEEWQAIHSNDDQKYIDYLKNTPEKHLEKCERILDKYRFYIFENTPEEVQTIKFDLAVVHAWYDANHDPDPDPDCYGSEDQKLNEAESFIGWAIAYLVSMGVGKRIEDMAYEEIYFDSDDEDDSDNLDSDEEITLET